MSAPDEPGPPAEPRSSERGAVPVRKHAVVPKEGQGTLWAGRPETSKRRRSLLRRTLYRVSAPVVRGLARALWCTQRLEVVAGREHLDRLAASGEPCVPCLWHESLVAMMRLAVVDRPEGLRPALLISPSVDGDFAALVASAWRFHVLRGSATRTGGRAIRQLYHAVRKQRVSPIIPADGPHGPAHAAKPGAVMLSQLAQVAILPLGFAPSRALRLPSWDRLAIPLPFARIRVACGEPLRVPRDLASEALEAEAERLTGALDAAAAAARAGPARG